MSPRICEVGPGEVLAAAGRRRSPAKANQGAVRRAGPCCQDPCAPACSQQQPCTGAATGWPLSNPGLPEAVPVLTALTSFGRGARTISVVSTDVFVLTLHNPR